jgi:CBS domain containing-hemolysin-like protein
MATDGSTTALWLDLLRLASVPVLVLCNGFFVAAEFALVAVRRTKVEQFVKEGRRGAASLARQVKALDHSIAATQLGITLASLGLGWLGEVALANLLTPLFAALGEGWQTAAAHSISVVISFLLITFLHVVLGELVPKAMALQRPDAISLWVAMPLELFTKATRPIVVIMNGVGNWLARLLGFSSISGEHMVHSVEEMIMLVDEVEKAGLISPEQADYVENVFRLSSKKLRECVVPREKMAALDINMQPDRILEAVRAGAHTRMPVFDGDLDNIVGFVNTKDLFHLFSLNGVVILHDALYPPLYLQAEQTVADALRLFRRSHKPMALVKGEEGKIIGLITLEDLLEEIVGDIEDEHDRPTPKLRLKHPLLSGKHFLPIGKRGPVVP